MTGRVRSRVRRTAVRIGASVLEVLVALLLGLLLVHLVLETLVSVRRGAATLVRRSEELAVVRVARAVLAADVRQESAGPGRPPPGPRDSLRLRVVRGGVVACSGDGEAWTVRFEGIRAPEPSKDSLLLLGEGGRWTTHDLVEMEPSPRLSCPDGLPGSSALVRVEPPVPGRWSVGRYFERGSYHLTGAALRYRRGEGGRQPLTAPVLATPASHFDVEGGRADVILVFPFESGAGAALHRPAGPRGGGEGWSSWRVPLTPPWPGRGSP